MGDSNRSLLDPIWEYVLDDYDYESDRDREASTRNRRKLDRRRKKPQQEESEQQKEEEEVQEERGSQGSSLYLTESNSTDEADRQWQGFDVRDDTEDMGSIWKLGGAEEPSIQNTPKRHPWRRDGSSKELNSSGSDGSMWDILAGTEDVQGQMPQVATKSCLKTTSKYTADRGSANYGNNGSSNQFLTSTTQNDIGEIYQNSTATEAKPKKKVVFWKRSQSEEEKKPSKMYDLESSLGSNSNRSKKASKRSGRQDDENETYDEFDPVSMLLEVADALDPWGSETSSAASVSQESISVEKIEKSDDRSDSSYESNKEETLAKVPREKPSTPVTEIRLQYTPVVHGEQLEDSYYDVQPPSSVDMTGGVSNIEDNKKIQPSENAEESNHFPTFPYYDEDRRTVKFFDKDDYSNNTPENSEVQSRSFQQDWIEKRQSHQRSKLQRLVCCSAAKTVASVGSLRNMDPNDMKDVFPMTRMIADDQSDQASIYGKVKNGVMGVPSDRFLNTKGPQSLFAYDYESNEHMDVLYNEFGKPARRSLFLRKLGPPPALMSSSNADEVVIKVEASTVSETDNVIRRGGWWGTKPAPIPNTPGVDVVGKVYHIKQKACEKYGLRPQQTVLSLVRWGGNSRFLTIKPEQLVKVPDGLDPAQVACLPEMYLTAFQALHLGQSRSTRYRNNALKGKSVLVVGFMSNTLGSAIIELALRAGVANVYATAKRKHWKKLIKYGVMPLSQDPVDWILRVEGTIDLLLATNGGMREDLSRIHYRALNSTGQLVLCGHRSVGNDVPVGQWEKQFTSVMCSKNKALAKLQSKSHSCDVFDQWEKDLPLCKSDLEHLLQLLEKGSISPAILDRIPLSKVPRAHTLMESKQVSGFLICEPWMKGKQRAIYM